MLRAPNLRVNGNGAVIVVSIGIASLLKHRSFPRKREASPSAAHFQWLADEIPAFAGMTSPGRARSSQMTPLPSQWFGQKQKDLFSQGPAEKLKEFWLAFL